MIGKLSINENNFKGIMKIQKGFSWIPIEVFHEKFKIKLDLIKYFSISP